MIFRDLIEIKKIFLIDYYIILESTIIINNKYHDCIIFYIHQY